MTVLSPSSVAAPRRLGSLRRALVGVAALSAAAAATVGVGSAQADTLGGSFSIVDGSYFRMILPTGDASGPFLANGNSSSADRTFTPLDGTLVTGGYSSAVTGAQNFFGAAFTTATNAVDPQTGLSAAAPSISSDGGQLSGDLSSFGVAWNGQVFNQGAPKPDGSYPGKTSPVTGTIDDAGNYTIEWTSQIVGGPFNNFTGLWHLTGQYSG